MNLKNQLQSLLRGNRKYLLKAKYGSFEEWKWEVGHATWFESSQPYFAMIM